MLAERMAVRLSTLVCGSTGVQPPYGRLRPQLVEWRLLLVLNSTASLNVGELSGAADLDKAAVSRSLALLGERDLVSVEQTRTRGRAAIASLTDEGRKLAAKLLQVSRAREARLFKTFSPDDKDRLNQLLHKLATALAAADWDH